VEDGSGGTKLPVAADAVIVGFDDVPSNEAVIIIQRQTLKFSHWISITCVEQLYKFYENAYPKWTVL
jgi:hypothetical protein